MKFNIMLVITATMLLFNSCKPLRLFPGNGVSEVSFSENSIARTDSLHLREIMLAALENDLHRVKAENISLRSESLRHEIKYDSAAPVEVFTVDAYEIQFQKASVENEMLKVENSIMHNTVDKLKTENSVKKIVEGKKGNRRWFYLIMILAVLLGGWLIKLLK